MDATDWKCELNRLLELFQRESEISLRKISQCFVTLDRPFDENFRKYFLHMSSLRLDISFNTILMGIFYENQVQTTSNPNEIVRNANIPSSNCVGRLDVRNNGNPPDFNIESNGAAPVEIQVANGPNGDQKQLNTVQGPNDDDKLAQKQNESTSVNGNGIEIDVKPKIEIKPEAAEMDLAFVEFNPNEDNDRLTIENGATAVAESLIDRNQASSSATVQKTLNGENPDKPFKCSDCAYACKRKSYLKNHQKIHVQQKLMGIVPDPNNGLFKCTHCDQRFLKWHFVTKHLKYTHKNNERLFNCMHCMRRFTQKTERKQHELRCQNYRYECYLCKNYITRVVSQMQSHMRTHSGAKPFQCEVCQRCFRQKRGLLDHLISIH